jgi:hypothetical protein
MCEQCADRDGLSGVEFGREREIDFVAGIPDVGDGQTRSGPFDDSGDGVA